MSVGIVGTLGLVYAGFTVLAAAAAVSIVRKAGYSGWWVATAVVPLANVVMLFAFAFADWPALRQNRRAASSLASASGHPAFAQPSASPQPDYQQPAYAPPPYAPPYASPYSQPAAQPPAYQNPGPPEPDQPRPQYHPLYPPPGA